ncbi:MAG: ABC transporter ATP-binding protein [Elusimicrobia bacterium]|nr:ABC transporter ATP-binding protein [Elusimicrobiota bacterium]
MKKNIIEIKNLIKTYEQAGEQILVLDGVNFSASQGEFISVVGPSGCGKSTFLNIIGLLDCYYGGEFNIFQTDASKLSEEEKAHLRLTKIGFVFQFDSLLPEFTAIENVELPAMMAGRPSRKAAADLFSAFSMEKLADKNPREISGGEKQRIALLRAMRNSPSLILADEPTGNLDHNNAVKVLSDLKKACGLGTCVITVTHNLSLARDFSDRIFELKEEKLFEIK